MCMKVHTGYRISPSHPLFLTLKTARVLLSPKIFNVEVRGFECDGYGSGGPDAGVACPHGCSGRLVDAIEDVLNAQT